MLNQNYFSRGERNAIIVLLVIIFVLILFKQPIIIKLLKSKNDILIDSSRYFLAMEQLQQNEENYSNYNSYNNSKKYNNSYYNTNYNNFNIDINNATAEEFEKLHGIGKVYAERIIKYRNKIGGFNSIEQLKEVYGIHDSVFQKFKHQLRISKTQVRKENNSTINDLKIELNTASITELTQLNGIGNVYAKRITEFRDKLGGFYKLEQIKDVYGIHDTVFQKFKHQVYLNPTSPKKININSASLEELSSNPYFFSTLAKQIVGYRTKVKPFEHIDDLKKLYYIKDHPEYYEKILPYVDLE